MTFFDWLFFAEAALGIVLIAWWYFVAPALERRSDARLMRRYMEARDRERARTFNARVR